jgi:hypothetical protein
MALRLFTCDYLVVRRETATVSPTESQAGSANGDLGILSVAAAEQYARLYLARAGIVLSRRDRLVRGTDGIYRLDHKDAGGVTHSLGVCIDRTGGRLLLLADRPAPGSP